jgi:uncharacterized protein YuzE
MWAEPLGEDRYRLRNSPFYARGFSFLDIVIAERQTDGFPIVRRLLLRSGHSTYQLFVSGGIDASAPLPVLRGTALGAGLHFRARHGSAGCRRCSARGQYPRSLRPAGSRRAGSGLGLSRGALWAPRVVVGRITGRSSGPASPAAQRLSVRVQKMPTLAEVLPDLVDELAELLQASGRDDLAAQLREVEVTRWTHDTSCDAAYIYLRSPRPLNVVEQNVVGVKHGETVPVEHRRWVNVDTDNFGRMTGIELLSPGDVPARLSARIAL